MEADQVRTQQAVQKFALPWADRKCFRIWPWDVPEYCHAGVGPLLLDHPRQKSEVVILHQDYGLLGPGHFLQRGIGKLAIHLLVVLPIRSSKDWAGVRDVTERPQSLVGEAV